MYIASHSNHFHEFFFISYSKIEKYGIYLQIFLHQHHFAFQINFSPKETCAIYEIMKFYFT